MIEEKDFILREVQRLTEVLKNLIRKVNDFETGNEESALDHIKLTLKNEFNISISEISEIAPDDFTTLIQNMNEDHLEKVIELVFKLIKKSREHHGNLNLDASELIIKNIQMITLLDQKSKTFSMERMQIKNTLQKWS
ncbi:hypothetical protein I2486_13920 [Cellulophaga sp. E16_2]|uniref:Uncharacterized protein n=1 Tax=Cellulophaga algicola (strain DSM 14237 / IC166 / ACAM 630) TaxID=688270 RepID=E6XCX0_CELAD|nr:MULTISPECIES: hypothetical protein [Cellulophaga]ADV50111.1 hypothetical protein Celal_2832 [Cellulophaga algicola DSM 14237]MBO0592499.1 hypothetical protein [Cellulophaga sp. E16_2]